MKFPTPYFYHLLSIFFLIHFSPSCEASELTPTPTPRLAPDGTLFVIRPFGIPNETGIIGFKLGDKVQAVGNNEGLLSISAKGINFYKEADYFTNNLDELAAFSKNTPIAIPQRKPIVSAAPKPDSTSAIPRVEFLKRNLLIYKKEIMKMTDRIEIAADERESKRFYRYGGGRNKYSPIGTKIRNLPTATLSVEASNIISLIEKKDALVKDMNRNLSELYNIDPTTAEQYRKIINDRDN